MKYFCQECEKDLTDVIKLLGKNVVINMHTRAHRKDRIARRIQEIIAGSPTIDDAIVKRIQDACIDACETPIVLHEEGPPDDPCPECGTELEAQWSGVKCPKCGYAFCL